jgi:hypothetical protein
MLHQGEARGPLGSLLLKDYRLLRQNLALGLALALAPHAASVAARLFGLDARPWGVVLADACFYSSMGATFVTTMLVAGSALALERRDRTVRFLDQLPPSRLQVAGSKLLLTAGFLAGLGCLNALVFALAYALPGSRGAGAPGPGLALRYAAALAATAVMIYGVAWFFSATLNDPLQAALRGWLAPFLLFLGLRLLLLGEFLSSQATVMAIYQAVAIPVGLLGVGLGVACFVRRVPE